MTGVPIGAGAAGTDWIMFLGRLHPILVHLPIGVLAAVVVAECLAVVQRVKEVSLLRRALLMVAAGSAIAAATVGWFLAGEGGYAEDLLYWHRWGGVAFALVLTIGCVLIWTRVWGSVLLRGGVLTVALGLMTIVGHLGGSMTHGETYLARYAPVWLQGVLGGGAAASVDAGVDSVAVVSADAQIVLATLEAHCFECHGASKQKGSLRLDDAEGVLSVVVPGDPASSELFRRVALPVGHRKLMPPDSEPLGDETVLALMRWIRDGADTGEIEAEQERESGAAANEAAQIGAIESLTGAVITQVPGGDAYSVDLSVGGAAIGADVFAALGPIADRIGELSLAGRRFAEVPEGLVWGSLRGLKLERTDLTGEQIARFVRGAPVLERLNIHSTEAGDGLLPLIEGKASLREIVLFGTRVSDAGLIRLSAARPDLVIERGRSLDEAFAESSPRLILAADASKGRIALLREVALGRPEILWEHETRDIHDLHLLPNGHVLFQTSWTRLVEADPMTKEEVWSYDAAVQNRAYVGERVEVHAFERLAGGNTMIAESGPARIIEVDPDGGLVSETMLKVEHPDAHHDTRLVRTTPDGTYLVAHEKDGVVREYDKWGAIVWEYDVPKEWSDPVSGETHVGGGDQVFAAERLRSGNTLIGMGNGHGVIEVTDAGVIVWGIGREDLDGVTLEWVTNVGELSNGHIVIGNCHAGEGQPQIVEVNRAKEVVWKFYDFKSFGNALSNSFVTEDRDGFAYTE